MARWEDLFTSRKLGGNICSQKAEHIRSNWQDNPLADQWENWALVLDRTLGEL